jgi:predicted O-methyltransferase YrrM
MAVVNLAFPFDVDGWLSEREGEALYRWAKASPQSHVELGTYKGRSAICIAQAGPLIAVDHLQGGPQGVPGEYAAELGENLARYGLSDQVQLAVGETDAVAGEVENGSVGFIFIDADHDHAVADLEAWLPKLRQDSVIAFHDRGAGDVPVAIALALRHDFASREVVDVLHIVGRGSITG